MNVDPDLLRAFLAVSSYRSFTKAGLILNRTQSTISHQIRRLEEVLGTQVFKRDGKCIELTTSGMEFKAIASRIVDLNDEIEIMSRKFSRATNLKVGFNEALPVNFAKYALYAASNDLPDLSISFEIGMSEVLRQKVEKGVLDIAFVASVSPVLKTDYVLWRKPLVWVAQKGWMGEVGKVVPLVLCAPPCTSRKVAIDVLRGQGIAWSETITLSNYGNVRDAVGSGLGISILALGEEDERCRCLGSSDGLPVLPDQFLNIICSRKDSLTDAVSKRLVKALRDMSRKTSELSLDDSHSQL